MPAFCHQGKANHGCCILFFFAILTTFLLAPLPREDNFFCWLAAFVEKYEPTRKYEKHIFLALIGKIIPG